MPWALLCSASALFSIVVAYLFQKHVINKGIARGGPRIMLPMGVMGGLLAVVGLVLVIRGLL